MPTEEFVSFSIHPLTPGNSFWQSPKSGTTDLDIVSLPSPRTASWLVSWSFGSLGNNS